MQVKSSGIFVFQMIHEFSLNEGPSVGLISMCVRGRSCLFAFAVHVTCLLPEFNSALHQVLRDSGRPTVVASHFLLCGESGVM